MGFVIIDYKVKLTRAEVVSLLLDSEAVPCVTTDGEPVRLFGPVRDDVTLSPDSGYYTIHRFDTYVDFANHDQLLWVQITLTTTDRVSYLGVITPNPRH